MLPYAKLYPAVVRNCGIYFAYGSIWHLVYMNEPCACEMPSRIWDKSCTCDMTRALRVTWVVHYVWHDSYMTPTLHVTWLVQYVRPDSYITRDMTHAYICAPRCIPACDVTHTYMAHDVFICYIIKRTAMSFSCASRLRGNWSLLCVVLHGTHTTVSCPTHGWVMSHTWKSHVQPIDASRTEIRVKALTHTDASCQLI